MTYRIRAIEPWGASQVIVWLQDEYGATGPGPTSGDGPGLQWCVRLTLPEMATTIADLLAAYSKVTQDLAVDLAAGGCRNCNNTRRVGVNVFAKLAGGDGGGEPCPVCIPRAERRLRDRVFGLPRRTP